MFCIRAEGVSRFFLQVSQAQDRGANQFSGSLFFPKADLWCEKYREFPWVFLILGMVGIDLTFFLLNRRFCGDV